MLSLSLSIIIGLEYSIMAASSPALAHGRSLYHRPSSDRTKLFLPRSFIKGSTDNNNNIINHRELLTALCSASDVEEDLLNKTLDPNSPDYDYLTLGEGEAPIEIRCYNSDQDCPYYIYEESDAESNSNLESLGYTPTTTAPTILTKPCVKCEFTYESYVTSRCQDVSCQDWNCLPSDRDRQLVEAAADVRQENDGEPPQLLRYDGLYYKVEYMYCGDTPSENFYFRFYQNHQVIGANSSETPEQVKDWLNLSDQNHTIQMAAYSVDEKGKLFFRGTFRTMISPFDMPSFAEYEVEVEYNLIVVDITDSTFNTTIYDVWYDFVEVDFDGMEANKSGTEEPSVGLQNYTQPSITDTVVPSNGSACRSVLYSLDDFGSLYEVDKDSGNTSFVTATELGWRYSPGATDSTGRFIVMKEAEPSTTYIWDPMTHMTQTMPAVGAMGYESVLAVAIDSTDTVFAVLGASEPEGFRYDILKIGYLGAGAAEMVLSDVGNLTSCSFTMGDELYCLEGLDLFKLDLGNGEKEVVPNAIWDAPMATAYDPCENRIWVVGFNWDLSCKLFAYNVDDGTVMAMSSIDDMSKLFFRMERYNVSAFPGTNSSSGYETIAPVERSNYNLEAGHVSNQYQGRDRSLPPRQMSQLSLPMSRCGFTIETLPPTTLQTNITTLPPEPEDVRICLKQTRVDFFALDEFHSSLMYRCSYSTAMKKNTYEWSEGVTNVHEAVYTLGDAYAAGDDDDDTLDVCTYEVDGVECNSCKLCDEFSLHLDGFEADCSNIVPSAKTSCDEWYETIDSKLFILQDGFVHPQTSRPQTWTAPPTTSATTTSSSSGSSSSSTLGSEDQGSGINAGGIVGIIFVVLMVLGLIYCGTQVLPTNDAKVKEYHC